MNSRPLYFQHWRWLVWSVGFVWKNFTMGVAGTVSGTATITYTATGSTGIPALLVLWHLGKTITLTGTIAESRRTDPGGPDHDRISWYLCCRSPAGDSGTWTSQLLAPVTGGYSGTLTGNGNTISVAGSFTEDTSQTSGNMGNVTALRTISGSPCFNSGTPLNLYPEGNNLASHHIGESFSALYNAGRQRAGHLRNYAFEWSGPEHCCSRQHPSSLFQGWTVRTGRCSRGC